jgi:hypothetical protein
MFQLGPPRVDEIWNLSRLLGTWELGKALFLLALKAEARIVRMVSMSLGFEIQTSSCIEKFRRMASQLMLVLISPVLEQIGMQQRANTQSSGPGAIDWPCIS